MATLTLSIDTHKKRQAGLSARDRRSSSGSGIYGYSEREGSELCNLRAAGYSKDTAQSQSSSSCSAVSNRHRIRRISSHEHLKTLQNEAELSKWSISFILDDQAASMAVGKIVGRGLQVVANSTINVIQETKTLRLGAKHLRRRSPVSKEGLLEIEIQQQWWIML